MARPADHRVIMRQASHKLVGVLFWLLLVAMWLRLADSGSVSAANVIDSIQYVAVIGGAVVALTLFWVRHNVAIHRRKGPRAAGPVRAPRTDVDRLGRQLLWSLPGGHAAAVDASHLVVEIEDDLKVYRRA